MDVMDNDFLVDKEYQELAKKFNETIATFWKNRIYSFRNVCMKCEEDKFKRFEKINQRIMNKRNNFDYDEIENYSTDEEDKTEIEENYQYDFQEPHQDSDSN